MKAANAARRALVIAGILSLLRGGPAVAIENPSREFLSISADSIPSGLSLRFPPAPALARRVDRFLVLRSTGDPNGPVVSTDTAVWLDYYHDWYKDYYYPGDLRRTFYYQVQAYDAESRLLARNDPPWYPWTVFDVPAQGLILVPTAYRKIPLYDSPTAEIGRLLPVNFDITTIYFIGRIYGHNDLNELTNTRNVLFTRVGTSFIQLDGKVILEKESRRFPQIAVGAEGAALLRDGAQNPSFSVNFQKENSRKFTGLYAVASKQLRQAQFSLGWIAGSSPAKLIYLTELLPSAIQPDRGLFGGIRWQLTRKFSLETELIQTLGTPEKPWLLNLKLGSAVHTNFDVGYLHYRRGYEILAHFSFRYTLYPRLSKRK
ncbi:MAG: hypothetical protein AAB091_05330 [Elusimicrobiota bacterium]